MDFSNLKRPIQPMPEDVSGRLESEGLLDAYRARPAYQRNDYLSWIARAKRPETREKRIRQMISELRGGHAYMGMRYRAK
jgi:uncharacterized protein YdeI (YjbR/CyaY-like superfamily)